MALSGGFNSSAWTAQSGDRVSVRFEWTATQSLTNNTSTISWRLVGDRSQTGWVKSGGFKVIIDNETVYSKSTSYRISMYDGTVVASGTKVIPHGSDGRKTFSVYIEAGIYYYAVNCTGSSTFELTVIPKAATITSAPSFNDEQNPTIHYNNVAGNSASSLQACISLDGSAADVAYRDIPKTGSSYTFNLTEAERNVLRNATLSGKNSRTVKFYVKTVIGGTTYYNSVSKTFTVINCMPTMNPTAEDTLSAAIALTGDKHKLIKGYNKVAVAMNASALKGASITKRTITCGGQSISGNSGTLTNVESGSIVFTVTDNRGNTVTQTINKALINYVKLTCNLIQDKPDANGTMTVQIEGNYFNGSFGTTSNTLAVQYRYKTQGGSYGSWKTLTPSISGDRYSAYEDLTDLNYQTTYVFQARATDKLGTKESSERAVKTEPVFDWGENDFNFNVPVTINGSLTVTGNIIGNQTAAIADDPAADYVVEAGTASMGSNGTWYWRKWNSGRAECYGCRNYGNMGVSTAWGVLFRSEVFSQSLPSGLFTAAPEVIDVTFRNSTFGAWIAKHETSAPSANSSGSFIVVRPASATLSQAYISFNVIGRWK